MVAGLAARPKSVTEHESQRGLQHRFVGLLKTSLLVESQNLMSGGELLVGAGEESLDLLPINDVRFQLLLHGL